MPLETLFLFAATLFLVAVYPGALVLALVARVLETGWRSVLPFLFAIWIGEAIWLCAAVLGLAAVAANFETVFTLIKFLGIAYLAWLAASMWRRPVATSAAGLPESRSPGKLFFAGLALSLGSPEIMIFYLALLPSLIEMSAVTPLAVTKLLGVMLGVLALVDLSWVFFANRLRRFLQTPRLVRLTNKVSAGMMACAATFLALRN